LRAQWIFRCSTDELVCTGEAAHRRALERHSIDVEIEKLIALFHHYGVSLACYGGNVRAEGSI